MLLDKRLNSYVLILLAFLLLPVGAYCENNKDKNKAKNHIDKKGRKQGYWKKADPNRDINYEGYFKDDMPYGKFIYTTIKGNLVAGAFHFREGYASYNKIFYPDSTLMMEGYYLDKLKDSTWLIYNEKGILLKKEFYKAGLLNGRAELYNKDGESIEKLDWFRGLRHGQFWQKTDGGFQSFTYNLNKTTGLYTAMYPDSSLFIKGYYDDGLKEKTWDFYLESGNLYKKDTYSKGKLISKRIFLEINNKLHEINTDTIAFVYKNARAKAQLYTTNENTLISSESYDVVCDILESDYFFHPNNSCFVAYKQINKSRNSGIKKGEELRLNVKTPFPIIIDNDGEANLNNLFSDKVVEDE